MVFGGLPQRKVEGCDGSAKDEIEEMLFRLPRLIGFRFLKGPPALAPSQETAAGIKEGGT